jgi:5-deoxy-5-amino-3-dehydroquinate synthase
MNATRVPVKLGDRSYDVLVGRGARRELANLLPETAARAVVVTQASIPVEVDTCVPTTVVEIPEGESAKSLATVERCCRAFAAAGLSRGDVVVGLGGGLVTDVAGFAASAWHRGTAVVHVATTLLAQVDAAIGGKTGVNLPEGKNLVGSFWQPSAVICDTETLESLPAAEWRSGRGELAKYAFLGVEDLDELALEDQIVACVSRKAEIVAADEREAGSRMVLNYGHTLAHALEAAGIAGESAPLRHGEAVAVGLVFAARLAQCLGRIDESRVARHEDVVARYGLPSRLPRGADVETLVTFMRRDKKSRQDLTFVLDGPDGVEVVHGVGAGVVTGVLEELREEEAA